MEDQAVGKGAEPESRPSQEDLTTPFPIGAKTRPMTRFASKQGPSTQNPSFYEKAYEGSRQGVQFQEAEEIGLDLEID